MVLIYPLCENLAQYIVQFGELTGLKLDQGIFYDYTPTQPDELITFNEYKGSAIAMFTTTSVRSVQCMSRANSNTAAMNNAWAVYNTLLKEHPFITLGGVKGILSMRDTPFRLGTDGQGRSMWAFNMGITYNYTDWVPPVN